MFAKSLGVIVLSSVLAVQAQSATPSLSACMINCLTNAAGSAGCSSFTDLSCVCTSAAFQSSAAQCLGQNCSAADLAAAQSLQSACGSASATATSPVSTTTASAPTTTGSASSSSTKGSATSAQTTATTGTSTSTSTSTSTGGALGKVSMASNGVYATFIASAFAVVGAGLLL